MNTKLLLLMVVGVALVCSGSVSALWWNSTAYPYANEVFNFTSDYSYVANGTSGFCGSYYHFLAGGGQNYIAKTASGCGGDITFANESEELPNFMLNSSGVFGYKTDEVYPGAVLVMPLDENSGNTTTDLSGNSNTGNCTDASGHITCNWNSGKFGSGISFNGVDDHINCGNDPIFDVTDLTLSLWIYPTSFSGYEALITKRDGASGIDWELKGMSGDKIVFYSNAVVRLTWSGVPPLLQWTHIVLTKDSTRTMFYVNGTNVQNGTTLTFPTGDHVVIGGAYVYSDGSYSYGFNGSIDEVRIYNRSLSPEEVQEHYQNGIDNRTSLGAEETSAVVSFSVSINSPANETVTSDNTTDHNFTSIGTEATYDCTVYYNDTSKGTNASVQNNTATVITSTEVPNGVYNVYVNCTADTTTNQSEIYTITINSDMTSINAPTIVPSTLYETQECTALTTAVDGATSILILYYNWTVDGVQKLCGNKSILSGNETSVPILGAGNYSATNVVNITVKGWDGFTWGLMNSSEVTVSALPTGNGGVDTERFIIRHGGML